MANEGVARDMAQVNGRPLDVQTEVCWRRGLHVHMPKTMDSHGRDLHGGRVHHQMPRGVQR